VLLGGDFRRRVEVERLRVVAFGPLDLRAVDDLRVPAAFVRVFAVEDLARVVDRRVPFAAEADLRVDAALVPDVVLRRVVAFLADVVLRRVVAFLADVVLRLVVGFVADAALAREVDAAEDLRRDVDALRRDVDALRFDVEPRAVTRFATPARAVAAFSSCATPLATSSCATATALSTGFRPVDRFDLVVFRAAITFSRQVLYLPLGCRSMGRLARGVDNTLLTHNTPCDDTVDASSRRVHATAALRRSR
jgi:hypothetical protein